MQTTAPVILLTRPTEESERLAADLRARLGDDVRILISPVMDIAFTGPLPSSEGLAGLIFTSRNGVRAWRDGGGAPLPCYCVGEGTAALAREAGMTAITADGDGAALAKKMAADRPKGRWLHVHGAHVRTDLAAILARHDVDVIRFAAYDQVPVGLSPEARACLAGTAPVVLPVFSPRTGKLIAEGEIPRAPLYIVAMSAAVADALAALPRQSCTICAHPDMASMIAAAEAEWRRAAG